MKQVEILKTFHESLFHVKLAFYSILKCFIIEIITFFDWWLRFCKCRTWPARPKPPMLARICSECLWLGGRCILFSIWAGRRWASTTLVPSILWWRSPERSRRRGTRLTSPKRIRPNRLVKRGRMLDCRC